MGSIGTTSGNIQNAIDAYVSKDNRYISEQDARILDNAIKRVGLL